MGIECQFVIEHCDYAVRCAVVVVDCRSVASFLVVCFVCAVGVGCVYVVLLYTCGVLWWDEGEW